MGVGEKLTNRLEAPDGKAMTNTVEVTVVDPPSVFETAVGTRLKHVEVFSGLLVPLVMPRHGLCLDRDRSGLDHVHV